MQFEIKNYFTGDVKFTAELSADYESKVRSVKLGAAVQMAVQADTDLQGSDLTDADLTGADLRLAKLRDADLRDADLTGADLTGADLEGAKLRGANLEGADLEDANLRGSNLKNAKLRGASLRGSKLERADLKGADLEDANLLRANLKNADLRGAKLRNADLRGAKLEGASLQNADLRIYHGIYSVIVTPSHVHIGCQRRTPEKWLALTEDSAAAIDGEQAVEALRQDGPVIKAMIEQVRPDLVDRQSARLPQPRDEAFAAIAQVRGLALHYQNTRPHPVRWKHVQQICDAALDATDHPAAGEPAQGERYDRLPKWVCLHPGFQRAVRAAGASAYARGQADERERCARIAAPTRARNSQRRHAS